MAKKKPVADPLESAKLESPIITNDDFDEVPVEESQPKEVTKEEIKPKEKVVPPTITKNPSPSEDFQEYVVKRDIQICWFGQMVRLKSGTVVSKGTHGNDFKERMENAGVQLEELKKG